MTNLKRAGPPRAGPIGPLTKKAPAATGALWSSKKDFPCEKNSASSDGTGGVTNLCALSPVMGGRCHV